MPPEVVAEEAAAVETVVEEPVTQVDPAPVETQTEGDLPVVAAGETQEAATDRPLTQADFDRLWAEKEQSLRQQTIEEARDLERRQRQSEEGRKAAQARQQAQLRDAVQVSLIRKLGVTDVDDETADDIISRVRGVETSAVEQGTVAAIDEAISAAAAKVVGINPGPLSPEADRYLGRFVSYMERLLTHDAIKDYVSRDAKKAWEAELPKIVDAEITKRNGSVKPLVRPEGQPSGSRRPDAEVLADPTTPIQTLIEIRARQNKGG